MPLGSSMPASGLPSNSRPHPSANFRRQRRIPHRVPCRVCTVDEQGVRFPTLGETLNVSDEGLAVVVGIEIAKGQTVEVLIPHLDGEPACLYGEVVHRRRVSSGTIELGIELQPAPSEVA